MNWNDYHMGFARHAATKSKDSTKVGATLVGPEGEVRLTGFNGPPKGVADNPERFERPTKYLYASHAEANLIAFAAREGIATKGCSVYTTHHPCAACTRTLIQAGIARVFYASETFGTNSEITHEIAAAKTMFEEAGVAVERVIDYVNITHVVVGDGLSEADTKAFAAMFRERFHTGGLVGRKDRSPNGS